CQQHSMWPQLTF
nr:immunoglobulin light chain junction region [Macaca mulatta]